MKAKRAESAERLLKPQSRKLKYREVPLTGMGGSEFFNDDIPI
jgi:hypothetical protein